MSNALRTKGKNTVVWVLMILLIFGLGGFGVTSFSGGQRSIGRVGGSEIGLNDYARALRQEMSALSAQTGKPVSMTDAVAMGLDRAVQARLFSDAALDEQARRIGISVGDGAVRDQILSARGFQGMTGGFDREVYKMVLRDQGLTEAEFEAKLRAESARLILQGAVVGGVTTPKALSDSFTAFITETRSIAYAELTEADVTGPLAEPTEADLRTHHTAHGADFTRPETRQISYVWLSPEALLPEVKLDETALRAAYEARIDEFVTPERRLVERLVYPSEADATEAKARLDAGKASFADLAAERGLSLADIDMGEVSRDALGAAAEAVFALEEPGVVGPLPSDLGPALYAMNGILDAQEISFEAAREELSSEAGLDQARRMILDRSAGLEDLLAGGATLEQVAAETEMEAGSIAFTAQSRDGIAAYPAFRAAAAAATPEDFPELIELDDGGVFALRLDAVEAPQLIPFEDVADQVEASWKQAQLRDWLQDRAEEIAASVDNGAMLSAQGLVTTVVGRLPRGGYMEGVPPLVGDTALRTAPGKAAAVEADGRVFVVVVDEIHASDPNDTDVAAVRASVEDQLAQSLAQDLFDLYARAVQSEAGITLDTQAIAAVQAQLQ
ncbi:peptidylprolyl isomerase [Phaeovulum veldkampii]|uniref:peptidylprolyl isomerase n=1 Tax=Phaeovulum veldkampii TaxID=33049 RepID=UPI0010EE15E6|nr:peptidylprolyl isomerase [Phaeovulum veldkampii]TDQ57829.1 peptidyl-prolyl cis-trans isomerase D [Phaeovulum veldkampii DSM 11550]